MSLTETSFALDSGTLSLAFTLSGRRLRLAGLGRAGGCTWLGGPGGDLWRIELVSGDGGKTEIGSEEATVADVTANRAKLQCQGKGMIRGHR